MDSESTIERTSAESLERLDQLRQEMRKQIDGVERQFDDPEICIYATGSLARHEATVHSDLDAFFMLSGSKSDSELSRIRDVKVLNAVITSAESACFPDFSNDGEYLCFMHIDDVISEIGSRNDDFYNMFTARMLMLLESKYLYNEDTYDRFKSRVVESYFRDFHDHSKDFKPVFLLNDILRFWRTLCLNYEHSRKRRDEGAEKAARGHLDNLKLRFSRMNICYSFIAHLLARPGSLTAEDVIATSNVPPLQRLAELPSSFPELENEINDLMEKYSWFLENVGREKQVVLEWISNREQRESAFKRSRLFVEGLGQVVKQVAEKNNYLRYLIV
ncbi:MAG: DUF294 nucleotidyltransferase-like domain-containing protein [Parasphingopyxis sp.]|uniref:DUF294 nucleotidyltransferase-like domain-containing protein n=1 Tax=Parasphingopyxis sp. TaxID=1920299 RepID=UPI0032EE1122